jgi:hypothetical protein
MEAVLQNKYYLALGLLTVPAAAAVAVAVAENRTSGSCSPIIIQNRGTITFNCPARNPDAMRLLAKVQELQRKQVLTDTQLKTYIDILNETVMPTLAQLGATAADQEVRLKAIESRIDAALLNQSNAAAILGIPANSRADLLSEAEEIIFSIRDRRTQRGASSCIGGLQNRTDQSYFNIWCRDSFYGPRLLELFQQIHRINQGR